MHIHTYIDYSYERSEQRTLNRHTPILDFLFIFSYCMPNRKFVILLRSARCNVEVDACAESGNLAEIYVTQHYKDVRLLAKKYYYHKRVCGEHTQHTNGGYRDRR